MNNNIQKYPAYKPSGAEWLGEIPEHWEAVALGSILELKSDKNHPDYEVLSVYREYGVIQKDSRDDNHNATSLDKTNYKAVNPGDLVVNKMKAWQGSMGISSYKGIVSPAYITCNVTSKKIVADFLHQLLRSQSYIGEYNRISYGVRVGQWDMHYEDFKRVTVLLPPEEEQLAISSFLDHKTTQIDQAIAQKERMIELLKERRQILIQNAVTKGINPNVKLKDSGVEWIGKVPEHWEMKKLKFLYSDTFSGGTPSTDTLKFWDGGISWISSADVKTAFLSTTLRNISDLGLKRSSSNIARKGSVIIVTRSGILQHTLPIAILMKDMAINQDIKCFVLKEYLISPNYLLDYVQGKNNEILVETRKQGATVESIEMEDFANLTIPVPPINEQTEVLEYNKNISGKIAIAISLKEKEIEKLKEYKATLINSAVTGKIKVC